MYDRYFVTLAHDGENKGWKEPWQINGFSIFIDFLLFLLCCYRIYFYFKMYNSIVKNLVDDLEKYIKFFVIQMIIQFFLAFINMIVENAEVDEWILFFIIFAI